MGRTKGGRKHCGSEMSSFLLTSESEQEEVEEEVDFIDKKIYRFDKIFAHNGSGAQCKYLVQYRGKDLKGDIKRVWLRSRQVEDRVALQRYRRRISDMSRIRSLSKKMRQYQSSNDDKPQVILKDSSTQVNFDSRHPQSLLASQQSSSSSSTRRPNIKLVFNMSTQTDQAYFVWDV